MFGNKHWHLVLLSKTTTTPWSISVFKTAGFLFSYLKKLYVCSTMTTGFLFHRPIFLLVLSICSSLPIGKISFAYLIDDSTMHFLVKSVHLFEAPSIKGNITSKCRILCDWKGNVSPFSQLNNLSIPHTCFFNRHTKRLNITLGNLQFSNCSRTKTKVATE